MPDSYSSLESERHARREAEILSEGERALNYYTRMNPPKYAYIPREQLRRALLLYFLSGLVVIAGAWALFTWIER